MQKMGTGALVALTAALAAAPAYAQTAASGTEPKPAITRGYNALESTVANNGQNNVRERVYTNFTLNKGPVPLTWSGFNEANVGGHGKIRQSGIGYNALLAGSGDTKPMVVFSSNYDKTGVRVGVRDERLRKALGFDSGYIDVASGTKEGNITTFLGKNMGPTTLELYNITTRGYGGRGITGFIVPYSELQENLSFDKLSKVNIPKIGGALRAVGKAGKRVCPSSVCSDVELLYRREFVNWNECPGNVAGVRFTFR